MAGASAVDDAVADDVDQEDLDCDAAAIRWPADATAFARLHISGDGRTVWRFWMMM